MASAAGPLANIKWAADILKVAPYYPDSFEKDVALISAAVSAGSTLLYSMNRKNKDGGNDFVNMGKNSRESEAKLRALFGLTSFYYSYSAISQTTFGKEAGFPDLTGFNTAHGRFYWVPELSLDLNKRKLVWGFSLRYTFEFSTFISRQDNTYRLGGGGYRIEEQSPFELNNDTYDIKILPETENYSVYRLDNPLIDSVCNHTVIDSQAFTLSPQGNYIQFHNFVLNLSANSIDSPKQITINQVQLDCGAGEDHCFNGIKDRGEQDIDCGGECLKTCPIVDKFDSDFNSKIDGGDVLSAIDVFAKNATWDNDKLNGSDINDLISFWKSN